MRILMDAIHESGLLPSTPSIFLLNAFAYADTGSVANHNIVKPMHLMHTWKSKYGYVTAGKYSDDRAVSIVMETDCETSLVAKALGVFDYFIHNSSIEAQDIYIIDENRNINIRMEDLNADNISKLVLPTNTSEEWCDSNVLPILEKIW